VIFGNFLPLPAGGHCDLGGLGMGKKTQTFPLNRDKSKEKYDFGLGIVD
jgi:hypothetical protein